MSLFGKIFGSRRRETPTLAPLAADCASLAPGRFCEFGFALREALAQPSGNLFFSPASIGICLSMLIPGARGSTRDELCSGLGLSADELETLGEEFAEFAKDGTLSIANAVFAQKGYEFLPGFEGDLQRIFAAQSQSLDLQGKSGKSAMQINDWCSKQTHGMIPEIVSADHLAAALLVLVNAIYFKADWQRPFEKFATQNRKFHGSSGITKVAMMHQHLPARYAAFAVLSAVELPYKSRYAMTIILPDSRKPDSVFGALGAGAWLALDDALESQPVDLALPRFELESQFENLTSVLSGLGICKAFTEFADFSAATDHPEGLMVSDVIHRAKVKVEEQGTEAAAVTAALTKKGAAPAQKETKPVQFHVDRPFLFVICDLSSRTPLFIGQIRDLPATAP